MKGKKQYKNDRFAKCDGCGARIYREDERHYKFKCGCSSILGSYGILDEAYCTSCDREGLRKHLEKLNQEGLLKSKKNKT